MARVYQQAHAIDTLLAEVRTLKATTAELQRARGLHEEKITNLTKQNQDLAKKNTELETRVSANEHNTVARISNLHLSTPTATSSSSSTITTAHSVLTPLHDIGTDRPMRNFPRHERDIKTMGQAQVIQCLQALGVSTLGMGAAEKKQRLRMECGLRRGGDD